MFFGNGVKEAWFCVDGHTSAAVDRILRIEPTFDGDFSQRTTPLAR